MLTAYGKSYCSFAAICFGRGGDKPQSGGITETRINGATDGWNYGKMESSC